MRIYGSSPLYQYVELIFRCKRMFILAVIVGTTISSAMVYMRSVSYQASIIVALTGDPDNAPDVGRATDAQDSPANRKANRLWFWVQKDPNFMLDVLSDAGLVKDLQHDQEHPDNYAPTEAQSELIRKARAAIAQPVFLNSLYMEMSLVWPRPKEAESLLNALYGRFARLNVETETAAQTFRRKMLQQQYDTLEAAANRQSAQRVAYLTTHYWQQTAMMGTAMADLDRANSERASTQNTLNEVVTRRAAINQVLARTPKEFVKERSETTSGDPAQALRTKEQDMKLNLDKLLQRYADQHPLVVAAKKDLIAIQEQIKAMAQAGQDTGGTKTVSKETVPNPQYQQLVTMRDQFDFSMRGLQRRVSDLDREISTYTARVKAMPGEEVAYADISRKSTMVDSERNQTMAQLEQAKIDEDRAKSIKSQETKLVVPPRAEKLDSGGKTAILYAVGPLLGLVIAFCFSLLAESLDHTLRTPVEVEKYLGKSVLAVIPRMQTVRPSRKQLAGAAKRSLPS